MFLGIAMIFAASATNASEPVNEADQCGKGHAEILIGMPYNQNSKTLVKNHFKQKDIRWIMPDSAITQDYSPTRLNIEVAKNGKIKTVWCG